MTITDPEQKKQLIEFYKAMKMATRMFSKGSGQKAIINLADQIIEELKKENPDEGRIKDLADRLQLMANPNH
jgi:pantothenate synthetase